MTELDNEQWELVEEQLQQARQASRILIISYKGIDLPDGLSAGDGLVDEKMKPAGGIPTTKTVAARPIVEEDDNQKALF